MSAFIPLISWAISCGYLIAFQYEHCKCAAGFYGEGQQRNTKMIEMREIICDVKGYLHNNWPTIVSVLAPTMKAVYGG